MATPLESGNSWQSPRISFTFDFSQTETESTTNDWQSPRISFSLNLSQTGGISPENREREDVANANYDTDFEFCVICNNGRNLVRGETLRPIADELFVDGKIMPLVHGHHVEAQAVTIASHLGLERSRCQSPVRSTSSPPSKITSSCWRNVASKYLRHIKHRKKWKEIMLKLNSKEDACAENRRTSSKLVVQDISADNVQQLTSCTISMWPFSRTCSTGGGQMKGNCLFCSLPWSRIPSTSERSDKAASSGSLSKEIETNPGLVRSSKPLDARSIIYNVQYDPRSLGELKPGLEPEDGKEEKQTPGRSKVGSPGLPASKLRGGISHQQSTGNLAENGRLMVRNLQTSSSTAGKAANLDSPRPGKPMAKGSIPVKANNSMEGGVRVNPVLNVPVCISIGYVGGGWNGGSGLFGFFSKREKNQPQPSAYLHHRTHASANRKKGT